MDTREFFDAVLPSRGRRCIAVPKGGKFEHYFGSTNDWAAEAVRRIDATQHSVYFGCASYQNNSSRKAENVEAVRSFWFDIDTKEGKPKEHYADRKEALKAALAFYEELGLPKPMIVSSGYGIHGYTLIDEDMTPEAWSQTATIFKKAMKVWGLRADPTRTADVASVLRPIGAHNYKNDASKDVKLVMKAEATISQAEFHMKVERYLESQGEMDLDQGALRANTDLNSDLITKTEYAPSDAEKIADHCAVMREMRDTLGDMDQPTWYGCVGVAAFTEQGEDICHEWSKGHSGYRKSETSAKYQQARKFAPTTCERFESLRPDVCAACKYRGTIKSPITLGTSYGSSDVIATDMLPDDVQFTTGQPTHFVFEYPKGYGFGPCGEGDRDHGLFYEYKIKTKNDDGTETWEQIRLKLSDVLFYPINRIRSAQGTYSMNLFMKDKHGRGREFILDNGVVQEGGRTLNAELGRREIAVPSKIKNEVGNYLTAWIGKLRDDYVETPAVIQYGWHDKGFVIGETFLTPNETRKAVVTKAAASMAPFMIPQGDLATWISLVDQAYNRPDSEEYQFSLLSSFAAPLLHMLMPRGGMLVHAHGKTGRGKTTMQKVSMSVWGNPTELLLSEGQEGSTSNALYNHFGVMCNLPVVLDEMTNCSNAFASGIAYCISRGSGKKRLNADLSAKESLGWSTIVSGSSNNMISEKLANHRADAEAELARLWEFRLICKNPLPKHIADDLFAQFEDNYGVAGQVYAKYLVENYDVVKNTLIAMRKKFDRRANITQTERYWSALHACILTALGICRKLGLLRFDADALMRWILVELANNRGSIVSNVAAPLEQFGDMVADIFNNILVTRGEGNLANGSVATVIKKPFGNTIAGRSIIETGNTMEKLFISVNAAKEWCNKKHVSYKDVFEALVAANLADPAIKRMSLGKGTEEYSGLGGPVKVIEVNPSAVRAVMGDDHPVAQKITGLIQGGIDSAVAVGTV